MGVDDAADRILRVVPARGDLGEPREDLRRNGLGLGGLDEHDEIVATDVADERGGAGDPARRLPHERAGLPQRLVAAHEPVAVAERLEVVEVDPQVAGQPCQRRLRAHVAGAADDAAHARDELLVVEGLGQVVVGAGGEALELVGLQAARRQHDDGDVLGARVLTKAPHQLEAAHARHHHVGDHHVGDLLEDGGERLVAVAGQAHLEAGGTELHLEEPRDGGLVLHDQHAAGDLLGHRRSSVRLTLAALLEGHPGRMGRSLAR